ncbi:HPF/RaiA family ribosome-associated protein [Leptolyngbya sp. 7M]|uniref:HPF/RaiA family ribosome-associated protein n=1 Tax=Leptolyngbya sp. 7M TaxID=2812896 RepID=UPI001B8BDF76|nr:HPF/RaiA family ribosome-associated protein [Leptolyngbya sp. 7M]QYO65083.1 HPF/RaiA family ribosome-associated protein [Leptolyngbya sp. 7M]
MAQHFIFHDCPPLIKERVRDYWDKKQRRIDRLLQSFPDAQRHLRLIVDQQPYGYQVRVVLSLPNRTLVAQSKSRFESYQAAMDEVAEILTEEIRRHKDQLRRDRSHRRRQQRQKDFATVIQFLEQDTQQQRKESFFDLLRPMLRNLQNHARRELIFAQLDGNVSPNEMTVSDLLDEAIVQAWEKFDQRPPQQPLDQWISRLMHEIIDEQKSKEIPAVSLDAPISEDDPRFQVASGWVLENEPFWDSLAPLTLEDILPQHEVEEPWDAYSLSERERWLPAAFQRSGVLELGSGDGQVRCLQYSASDHHRHGAGALHGSRIPEICLAAKHHHHPLAAARCGGCPALDVDAG